MGLLVALDLGAELSADVVSACLERGLLLNAVRPNTVRLMPPLIITEADVDEALGILDGVLQALAGVQSG